MMTRHDARQEARFEQVRDILPDWRAHAEGLIRDLSDPVEYEAYDFDGEDDVVEHVIKVVADETRNSPDVPREARHFLEDEVAKIHERVPEMVEEQFELPEEA